MSECHRPSMGAALAAAVMAPLLSFPDLEGLPAAPPRRRSRRRLGRRGRPLRANRLHIRRRVRRRHRRLQSRGRRR